MRQLAISTIVTESDVCSTEGCDFVMRKNKNTAVHRPTAMRQLAKITIVTDHMGVQLKDMTSLCGRTSRAVNHIKQHHKQEHRRTCLVAIQLHRWTDRTRTNMDGLT